MTEFPKIITATRTLDQQWPEKRQWWTGAINPSVSKYESCLYVREDVCNEMLAMLKRINYLMLTDKGTVNRDQINELLSKLEEEG